MVLSGEGAWYLSLYTNDEKHNIELQLRVTSYHLTSSAPSTETST